MPFANWTLSSALPTPEAVQATLFLPVAGEAGYYRSSRFDHGTMLGDVRTGGRTAFCSGFWRQPHDPMSTEAGIGLAAEWAAPSMERCALPDGAVRRTLPLPMECLGTTRPAQAIPSSRLASVRC